jgi:hypothetical protein
MPRVARAGSLRLRRCAPADLDRTVLPIAAQPFVHFDQWSADATVADSTIKITHSLLARGPEAIPLSGTISFDREIDLTGGPAAHAFTVTGTLQHPEVKATAEEVENQVIPTKLDHAAECQEIKRS